MIYCLIALARILSVSLFLLCFAEKGEKKVIVVNLTCSITKKLIRLEVCPGPVNCPHEEGEHSN